MENVEDLEELEPDSNNEELEETSINSLDDSDEDEDDEDNTEREAEIELLEKQVSDSDFVAHKIDCSSLLIKPTHLRCKTTFTSTIHMSH